MLSFHLGYFKFNKTLRKKNTQLAMTKQSRLLKNKRIPRWPVVMCN